MPSENIIKVIQQSLNKMRPSERKVADYILNHNDDILNLRIVDLAAQANVSEPTVVRFCRAIGFNGFQDFKLRFAQQSTQTKTGSDSFIVSGNDSTVEFSHKVFDSSIHILEKIRNNLDPSQLDSAISSLCSANRVEFYGYGASAAVAIDAQHKFFRLQMSTAAYSDPHLQNMSATSLSNKDVVVAISQSGRTQALLDALELVNKTGATVIGLAPSGTPVFEQAAIAIHIDVQEDTESYTPLSSRLAHLVLIDILAVGVYQRKAKQLDQHLQKLKLALDALRA